MRVQCAASCVWSGPAHRLELSKACETLPWASSSTSAASRSSEVAFWQWFAAHKDATRVVECQVTRWAPAKPRVVKLGSICGTIAFRRNGIVVPSERAHSDRSMDAGSVVQVHLKRQQQCARDQVSLRHRVADVGAADRHAEPLDTCEGRFAQGRAQAGPYPQLRPAGVADADCAVRGPGRLKRKLIVGRRTWRLLDADVVP